MKLELENVVVFITGGSKGIGLACAKAFLAEGARVAIASRARANIDKALTELPGALGIAVDTIDAEAAAAAVAQVEAELGPIGVLVNSAGAAQRTAPEDLTPAAWRAAMDAKYFSYIHAIDPTIKLMAARGRGVIVNVIGAGGKVASTTHIAGGAANAALMLATAGLARAYADKGVRVVGINPGLTETGRVAEGMISTAKVAGVSVEEAHRRSVAAIPMGRMAKPEEIADAVVFLASSRASYINGVNIGMDGVQTPSVV